MSITPRSSHLFAALLIALLLAAGGFGYWKSTQDRLPEGLGMGNGRLESTEVQIAAKIPGRLAEVRVDEGDKVLKGQLLARMDTRTLEAQRAQAEAEVLRARENFAAAEANVQLRQSEQLLANQELKRTQELYKRGFASSQLIDQQHGPPEHRQRRRDRRASPGQFGQGRHRCCPGPGRPVDQRNR